MSSPGYVAFRLAFEISPVILCGGIANAIPGGMLPIVAITEALNFIDGLLSGGNDLALDDFFAHFTPLPGGSLIDQSIGEYPFANQVVAANAVIANPLSIALRMICPAKSDAGYALKLATMTALQATLAQHNAAGGTYTVATPSFFYTNCLMIDLVDGADLRSKQSQNTWVWRFRRPLLTLQDAMQVQNNLMSKISAGSALGDSPSWSGLAATVGNPASLAGPSGVIPSTVGTAASNPSAPLVGGIAQ